MKEVGYYNGTIGPLNEISCPILDRAVYFGDGCYDATYVQNGVIFTLEDTRFLHCNIKTLNLIPSVYCQPEGKRSRLSGSYFPQRRPGNRGNECRRTDHYQFRNSLQSDYGSR